MPRGNLEILEFPDVRRDSKTLFPDARQNAHQRSLLGGLMLLAQIAGSWSLSGIITAAPVYMGSPQKTEKFVR